MSKKVFLETLGIQIVLIMILISSRKGDCLNIFEVLKNFELCQINIIPLESDIEILDFQIIDFPISFFSYDFTPKSVGSEGYHEMLEYGFNISKWTLCATELILLTKYETLISQTLIGYRSQSRNTRNEYCTQNFAKFPWTNCIIIINGMKIEIWNKYLQNYPNEFNHLSSSERSGGINRYEYYAVFPVAKILNDRSIGFQYICKTCFSVNMTILSEIIFTNERKLRAGMEKAAKEMTGNGKHLIFPSTSYLDVEGRKYGSADFITPTGVLSFHEKSGHSANFSLNSIPPVAFYLNYRESFTYVEILQSILFEHLPSNMSEFLAKRYRQLKSKNEVNVRALTLDIFYVDTLSKKFYYVFDESFNFVTCHGIQSPRNLGIYVDAFHWYLWLMLGIIIGTSSLILTLQYSSGNYNQTQAIYVVSFILENTFDYIIPKSQSKTIYRFVVVSLSITSIVIGNCYKAVITRDVILPIQTYLKYDTLNELVGFEFFVLPSTYTISSNDTTMQALIEYSQGFESGFYSSEKNQSAAAAEAVSTPWNIITASTFFERLQVYFMYTVEATEYFQRTNILASKEQVFRIIKDCTKKRALIGLEHELNAFLAYTTSQAETETLLKGKDEFLPVNYYWQIPLAAGPYLHERMSGLITSGIHDYWRSLYYQRTQTEMYQFDQGNQPLANNVHSNLGSLCKIYVIGIASAFIVFLIEVAYKFTKFRKAFLKKLS